jgi:hypothetical protein
MFLSKKVPDLNVMILQCFPSDVTDYKGPLMYSDTEVVYYLIHYQQYDISMRQHQLPII